jgi:hypothetical protein
MMAGLSVNMPRPVLHAEHNSPRPSPVTWQWSHTSFASDVPQMAHLSPCSARNRARSRCRRRRLPPTWSHSADPTLHFHLAPAGRIETGPQWRQTAVRRSASISDRKWIRSMPHSTAGERDRSVIGDVPLSASEPTHDPKAGVRQ